MYVSKSVVKINLSELFHIEFPTALLAYPVVTDEY